MTPEQFVYWLQGYAETHTSDKEWQPSQREWMIILDHLKEVFNKKTPDYQNYQISTYIDHNKKNTPLFEQGILVC